MVIMPIIFLLNLLVFIICINPFVVQHEDSLYRKPYKENGGTSGENWDMWDPTPTDPSQDHTIANINGGLSARLRSSHLGDKVTLGETNYASSTYSGPTLPKRRRRERCQENCWDQDFWEQWKEENTSLNAPNRGIKACKKRQGLTLSSLEKKIQSGTP